MSALFHRFLRLFVGPLPSPRAALAVRGNERFGTLAPYRLGGYSATVQWNGNPVDLLLDAGDDSSVDATLRIAYALWDDEAGWNERLLELAARELVPLWNEMWRDEGKAALTPAAFKSRLRLRSVDISADDEEIIWHYDCGGLFADHTIQVAGTLRHGPTRAEIDG